MDGLSNQAAEMDLEGWNFQLQSLRKLKIIKRSDMDGDGSDGADAEIGLEIALVEVSSIFSSIFGPRENSDFRKWPTM